MRWNQATLQDVGEAGLLSALRTYLGPASGDVLLGIGDDAAVLRRIGPEAVLTADMLVEGVDFERAWARPEDVGHKAAAVNLSDLAAMGARPRALLASLALRANERVASAVRLLARLHRVGAHFGAPLVGGDLSRIDGPLVVSVTAVGQVSRHGALRRGGGQAGDCVLVSGRLGGAAAGLRGLRGAGPRQARWERRLLRPQPRLALGQALQGDPDVRGCADLSDGLLKDALSVAAPGCGVRLEAARLPLERGLVGESAQRLALCGGEDFELVLAVRPDAVSRLIARAKQCRTRLTSVGQVVSEPGLQVHGLTTLDTAFDHFLA